MFTFSSAAFTLLIISRCELCIAICSFPLFMSCCKLQKGGPGTALCSFDRFHRWLQYSGPSAVYFYCSIMPAYINTHNSLTTGSMHYTTVVNGACTICGPLLSSKFLSAHIFFTFPGSGRECQAISRRSIISDPLHRPFLCCRSTNQGRTSRF